MSTGENRNLPGVIVAIPACNQAWFVLRPEKTCMFCKQKPRDLNCLREIF